MSDIDNKKRKRLGKGWKAALISIGSLLGLVVVAVCVVCWLVFTPSKLTGIVNKVMGDVLTCESHFDNVSLSLFKTFPYAGLAVKDVTLINPVEGAPSDTLAHIDELTLAVNTMAFIKDGDILVKQVYLKDSWANIYVAADGTANYDIIPSSEDDDDTSSTKLPDCIDIEKVEINNLNAQYIDLQNGLNARGQNLDIDMKGNLREGLADIKVSLEGDHLTLSLADSLGRPSLLAEASSMDIDAKGNVAQKMTDAKVDLDAGNITLSLLDTVGKESLALNLEQPKLKMTAQGALDDLEGKLTFSVKDGDLATAGMDWITKAMKEQKGDLLEVKTPYRANIDEMKLSLTDAEISLKEWLVRLAGDVDLPKDDRDLALNVKFSTDQWDASELMKVVPASYMEWKKGMSVDAKVQVVDGTAVGSVNDSILPKIDALVELRDGEFYYPSAFKYKVENIKADVSASLDLSKDSVSNAKVSGLSARVKKNTVAGEATLADVTGRQVVDASVKANVALADVMPLLDSVPLNARGDASVSLRIKGLLKDISELNLKKISAAGIATINNVDVVYDTIHASSPLLNIDMRIPAKSRSAKVGEVMSATIKSGHLEVDLPNEQISATMKDANIAVGLSNVLEKGQPIAAAFAVALSSMQAAVDTLNFSTSALSVSGNVVYDSTKQNLLKQLNPDLDIDLKGGRVRVPRVEQPLFVPIFQFHYRPEICQIKELDIHFGMSDYHLSGAVTGLENWLNHEEMLKGELNFTSDYTDLDQLLELISGVGTPDDTLAAQRKEDNVAKEANPFIVPRDVDFRLNTHIKHTSAFGNELSSVAGGVTIRDGVAILDQIGFVCKAAKMQMTGIYKSPRVNNIFVGLDFHLLDIQIAELIDMIPYVDTIVPMLKSFDGNADFHLAAETYLDAYYKPKMSTLMGAAALTGKDLVVLDSETFDKIAKLLLFKKKTVNKIDSIDVELTVFEKEAEVFPFVVSMDKYQVCAAGRHTLDNAYNYHLEILKSPLPMRLAVDVQGVMPKLNFKLGEVKYAELYKPEKQNEVQKRTMALKKMIQQSLERNVKEATRNAKRFD